MTSPGIETTSALNLENQAEFFTKNSIKGRVQVDENA